MSVPQSSVYAFSLKNSFNPVHDSRIGLGKGGELGKTAQAEQGVPVTCPGKGTATMGE